MADMPHKHSGWGKPRYLRKWHYFTNGEGFSLCADVPFFHGQIEDRAEDSPDNCAKCKRRLKKLRETT